MRRLCGVDVALYVDWGVSGSGDGAKRPEYQRLKADIGDRRIGSVCAYSLTRLGRNARELLGLIELCRTNDVVVRTAMESIDTSSAMGRAMVGVMAVFAELELEQGKERSASARAARIERHRAANLLVDGRLPAPLPPYGTRHVTRDGLTHVEPDPKVDLSVIVGAYEKAGSVRGAAVLLNDRGIPAPKGGKWNLTPLRHVLERLADQGRVLLPERNRARRHPAPKTAALFAGLLLCHCGRRMTPNVTRGQYYCAAARSGPDHGRMSVTEKALLVVLGPEAEQFNRQIFLEDKTQREDTANKEAVIERRQAALDARLEVGRIDPATYKAATTVLMGQLAELRRDVVVGKTLRVEPVPKWTDVAAMNAHLRRIWTHVQLDPDMKPLAYWRVGRRFDSEQHEAEQAWLDQQPGRAEREAMERTGA